MPEELLFGRLEECTRIEALLCAVQKGSGGAMVISGDAGTGKTALCRWAVARSTEDMVVITARGVQAESDLTYAGLSELLRPLLHHTSRIPTPQAAALSGALALAATAPAPPFVVNAATLSLLAAAAHAAPLLAMVDDSQWLDVRSLEALAFAARRVEADRVAMIFAVRDDERPIALDGAELPELRIAGLRDDAAQALVRSVRPETTVSVARHLSRETAGNPLALLELTRMLSSSQLKGQQPVDDPVPLGPHLIRHFRQRVESVPERTRRALLVAAASQTRSLAVIIPAIGELGLGTSDLEPAEGAGLLRFKSNELEFEPPLLRSAIYHTAPSTLRRAAHDALARVVAGDRRAWHLAAATIGPVDAVARTLEESGNNARRLGAFATAARAYEDAAARTGEPAFRARRLLHAARDYELAGRLEAATMVLDQATDLTDDLVLRADIQLLRARIDIWSGNAAHAYAQLLEDADVVRSLDPQRAALMYAEAAMACHLTGHVAQAVVASDLVSELARPLGGDVATIGMLISAHSLVQSGRASEGRPLLLRALQGVDEASPLRALQWFGHIWRCLTWMEDFVWARAVFEHLISSARHHEARGRLAYALVMRAELNFRTGRWTPAHADASESMSLAQELGQVGLQGAASAITSLIAAALGRERECRAAVSRTAEIGAQFGFTSLEVLAGAALGNLELALGHADRAIGHLEPVSALVDALGLGEPAAVMWTPDLIEAYVRTGRLRDARRTLDAFDSQAHSTQRTWALAAAQRCRGMLGGASDGDAAYERALALHDAVAMPFERARTQLGYGEQLRRANRRVAARASLHKAITTFDALGATPWSERARSELRATGARTPRKRSRLGIEALTPQELHVALSVADGLSNKEAAAALFLSPKTVEFHLSNVYRKLGLASRTQLANYLSRDTLRPVGLPSGSRGPRHPHAPSRRHPPAGASGHVRS